MDWSQEGWLDNKNTASTDAKHTNALHDAVQIHQVRINMCENRIEVHTLEHVVTDIHHLASAVKDVFDLK